MSDIEIQVQPSSTLSSAVPDLPPFPSEAFRGLFAEYLSIVEPISECGSVFHFANFLALISAEFADRIILAEGSGMFLNFFIFCCGISGTKKSTASDLVRDCIAANLPNRQHQRLTSVSSAEGLIRTLSVTPNVFLCYDEIKDLFATAGRTGQRIEPILNEAYSLCELHTVVKRQSESLDAANYYLTLLLNGTPEHVTQDLSSAMYHGGLLNRFLVFGGIPTEKLLPRMKTPDADRALALAQKIAALRDAWEKIGPTRRSIIMDLSPTAEAMHAEWYDVHEPSRRSMHELEAKPLTRVDVYAKKLAGIYCLLESSPSRFPRVTPEQMAASLTVMAYCKESMLWMTRAWSGAKTVMQQSEAMSEKRVEAYLQNRGCMDERTIYRRLHLSGNEWTKTLNSLVMTGIVSISGNRPRTIHFTQKCACFNGKGG